MGVLKGDRRCPRDFLRQPGAIATSAVLLIANGASAQHGAAGRASVTHVRRAFERTHRHFPHQMPQYNSHSDVYSSDSQEPNPFQIRIGISAPITYGHILRLRFDCAGGDIPNARGTALVSDQARRHLSSPCSGIWNR